MQYFSKVLNVIKKQSKDNKKKSIVIIEYQDLYEKLVDKINAKIEELEKQDRENRMSHNYLVIPILQSLLEKE